MSRVEVSYIHGELPGTRTESLQGDKVGFEFVDEPREGLFKIWANSEDKELTFFVKNEEDVICWDIEIVKTR